MKKLFLYITVFALPALAKADIQGLKLAQNNVVCEIENNIVYKTKEKMTYGIVTVISTTNPLSIEAMAPINQAQQLLELGLNQNQSAYEAVVNEKGLIELQQLAQGNDRQLAQMAVQTINLINKICR
jgi:hypothetical protein